MRGNSRARGAMRALNARANVRRRIRDAEQEKHDAVMEGITRILENQRAIMKDNGASKYQQLKKTELLLEKLKR